MIPPRETGFAVVAERAGFWRRALALLIDVLVVVVPFQVAVMILFPLTGGVVQMDGGLLLSVCQPSLETPVGSPAGGAGTIVVHCKSSLAGLMTANVLRTLPVGIASDGTPSGPRSYRLDGENKPVAGHAIDPIVQLSIGLYLIASLTLAGRAFGMRALRIAAIDSNRGGKPSLKMVFLRYVYAALGALPSLVWGVYVHIAGVGVTEAALGWSFVAGAVAALCATGWSITNLVLIIRKRDPLFDRWAGTAVVRERDRLTARV